MWQQIISLVLERVNWDKILDNASHVILLMLAGYVSNNPKYAWLVLPLQAIGQMSPQPHFTGIFPTYRQSMSLDDSK